MGNAVMQAVETTQAALDPHMGVTRVAFFNEDGTPATGRDETMAPITVAGLIGTAGKTTDAAVPRANTLVPVIFTSGNSAASATIDFATGDPVPILLGGAAPSGAELAVAAGGLVVFFYDGTSLHQLGAIS